MRKLVASICVAAVIALLLSGCRSSNEINSMSLVMGIAIDKGRGEREYEVTAQIAQVSGHSGGGEEAGGAAVGDEAFLNITTKGLGVSAAMIEISRMINRKLYTGHIQVVVIGREVAEDGIDPILNYFIGSADGRLSTTLLIADKKAKTLFEGKSSVNHSPASNLAGLVDAHVKAGELSEPTMLSFLDDMIGGLTAPKIPIVEPVKDENGGEFAEITGAAVFDGTKLKDVMTIRQSRAVFAVRNRISGGYQKIIRDGRYLTLRIEKASSHLSATVVDGKPSMTVTIRREYSVDDSTWDIDYLNDDERKKAEALSKEKSLELLCDTLAWARARGLDVFAFGEYLYRHNNRETGELLRNWREAFAKLEVEFEVEVTILGTGAILKNLEPVSHPEGILR